MPTYEVAAGRSLVAVVARSNMGPITFGTSSLSGELVAEVQGDLVCNEPAPEARVEIRMDELVSGNPLYDAELQRRMSTKRYPTATVELRSTSHLRDDRFGVSGDVTLQQVTRSLSGTVTTRVEGDSLVVEGEQVVDIRDFSIGVPTMLMLKIFPDVRVVLHLEADLTG